MELQTAHPDYLQKLSTQMLEEGATIQQKYSALFGLRSIANKEALDVLEKSLNVKSDLLRHDIAFCLGQKKQNDAIPVLERLLRDHDDHPMVRHEAAEALGAIGDERCMATLKEFQCDEQQEVRETVELAIQRIQYYSQAQCAQEDNPSKYNSVDPTPPYPPDIPSDELQSILLDEQQQMFNRYRALFSLRNRGGPAEVAALCAAFRCSSALLKHEIAYVLGQLQSKDSTKSLIDVLSDSKEADMVRHEAAEALGAIADQQCIDVLKQFCSDPVDVVAESCIVALDTLEQELSGQVDMIQSAG